MREIELPQERPAASEGGRKVELAEGRENLEGLCLYGQAVWENSVCREEGEGCIVSVCVCVCVCTNGLCGASFPVFKDNTMHEFHNP